MPRRVKIPVEMQEPEEPEAPEEESAPTIQMEVVDPSGDATPPASPQAPETAPKPTFNPDPDPTPPPAKPKKVLSEKQLAALAQAREKAKENARIKRLLKEGKDPTATPEAPPPPPPEEEAPPPPPPTAVAKKTKQERDAEKADKVMAAAKAKAKKQQAAPIKKAPKQVSAAEKASKENARRIKEGEAMKKAEFDARVARQVQAELRRQKAMEKLEAEEREESASAPSTSEPAPQNTVRPQQPKAQVHFETNPTRNTYQFMHDGEPAYVRMQKRGDSFMDRLMGQMNSSV